MFEVAAISSFFNLGRGALALPGGWPSIVPIQCPTCSASYVLYVDFDEPRHSVYSIVAQGLAAVDP